MNREQVLAVLRGGPVPVKAETGFSWFVEVAGETRAISKTLFRNLSAEGLIAWGDGYRSFVKGPSWNSN